MFCQVCGLKNRDDEEFCERCHSKLLVLSGVGVVEESGEPAEEIPFDEHLLERISTLEDVVKRTAEALKTVLESVGNLEKNLFVAHTGILALQETLERSGAVRSEEVLDLWETKMDERMQAVEKKDRFLERRDRIVAGYSGEDREGFQRRLKEAEFAILALDSDRGVRSLEELSRSDRQNTELGFYLAETYFSAGDLERAAGFFKRILSTDPNHFESLVYSGIAASEGGDPANAESLLKRAIDRRPDAFLPHFALGALYANGTQWGEAEKELRRALDAAPVISAQILLGTVLREKGELNRAIQAFEEAHQLQPDSEEAVFQLGLCYLEKNWTKRALDCFQQALEKNPKRLEYQEAVRLLERRRRYALPRVEGPGGDAYRRAEEGVPEGPGVRTRRRGRCGGLLDSLGSSPSGGQDERGGAVRPRVLEESSFADVAGHRLLRAGDGSRGLRRGPRLRARLRRASALRGAGRAQALPARGARVGPLQAQRIRAGDRLPSQVERARGAADDLPPPRNGVPRGRPARRGQGRLHEGENGRARRRPGGPHAPAGAIEHEAHREVRIEEEGGGESRPEDLTGDSRDRVIG